MSILSSLSDNKFTSQTYSIASQSKIILIKDNNKLFLRSAILAHSSPNQITSLFPIIDLFQHPSKITLNIKFLKSKKFDSFLSIFFLDLDLFDISKEKFNTTMKKSVQFHKQQFELLKKNIVLKDISVKLLSYKQISNFMDDNLSRIMKKFSYDLETDREKELFQKAIFSNNKIKQINYKRESVIPPTEIILGTTISNKEIGVNSHVLFLTGKKEFRRSIINST
jgi:hypothetical protein